MSSAEFLSPAPAILILGAANLILIVVCVAAVFIRAKRRQRQAALLNATIREYFCRSGVELNVACAQLESGSAAYTAFIESEPMKRFRLSHIIEMTLREHVTKTCGLQLDKIYWRFPLKEVAESVAATEKQAEKDQDSYINEGLVYYRDLPKGDVQEVSWEKFEESAAMNSTIDPKAAAPD